MRIIALNGMWCKPYVWRMWLPLEYILRHYRNDLQFAYRQPLDMQLYELHRMRTFVDSIVERYDDGTETVFLGHSMGGHFAAAAARRFAKSLVRGIVTVCTPHAFPVPLGVSDTPVPTVSIAAKYDELVWWGARHPAAIAHYVIDSNHYDDLRDNPEHMSTIADILARHFL